MPLVSLQVLDMRAEVHCYDSHAGMRCLHISPGICAGAACARADLLNKKSFQSRGVRSCESLIHAVSFVTLVTN